MEFWMFVAGVVFGLFTAAAGMLRLKVGTLRIDRSDPDDQPYLFAEMTKELSFVASKKYVLMEVSTQNYISQK